ncbi:hypothetical protein EDC01DRAFT_106339 [Geopyxis carbonaria]|nr:hypothetical protein EDC01DRAFT_106339 [Geopyxis carbonaria]
MAVGLATQNRYIGGYLAITVVSLVPALLRFYVLRHRRRTFSLLVSDVLFGLTLLIMVGVRVYDTYVMVAERAVRARAHSEAEVMIGTLSVVWLKYSLAEVLLHLLMIWLVKGAFVALYWGLVPEDGLKFSKLLGWALHATAVILVATWVAMVAVWLTFCPKLSDNWDLSAFLAVKFCSPHWGMLTQTLWLILTLITDIMIFIIPLTVLRRLRMSSLERKVLPLVFLMGMIPIVAPIVRYFVMLHDGNLISRAGTGQVRGITSLEKFHLVVILSYLETMGAVLAFSMPAFRGLLKSSGRPERVRAMVMEERKGPHRVKKSLTQLAMGTTYADEQEEERRLTRIMEDSGRGSEMGSVSTRTISAEKYEV